MRRLIVFRREMYAPGFAISPDVRPIISPGRRARSARSACGPAQRGKMRVLFRELDFSSLFHPFFVRFGHYATSFHQIVEARALVPHFASGMYALDFPTSQRRTRPFAHFPGVTKYN